MGFDRFVSVLALLLALTVKRGGGVRSCAVFVMLRGGGATNSLTTMKGRPCSSFITAAAILYSSVLQGRNVDNAPGRGQ